MGVGQYMYINTYMIILYAYFDTFRQVTLT